MNNEQSEITTLWRRHDLHGHEACRLSQLATGWRISGTAVFGFNGASCHLAYTVKCDSQWHTESAVVKGWVGTRSIDIDITRNADKVWQLNGAACDAVKGCVDIDLNFTPATNTLPIRRLKLAVGESATVRAAWLRFPSFDLEPLEQSYQRLEQTVYRYESAGGRFTARVDVDDAGLVTRYGNIWTREPH